MKKETLEFLDETLKELDARRKNAKEKDNNSCYFGAKVDSITTAMEFIESLKDE